MCRWSEWLTWPARLLPAATVQTLADRLSKALKRYLQMKDLGLPVGFPRFKTPNRWRCIQLRQYEP